MRHKPAKTRRTAHRLAHPEVYDLVDVLEGQTLHSIDEEFTPLSDRCPLHDRAYCRHCAEYGAHAQGWSGVDMLKWGPKKGDKGYREAAHEP